MELILKEVVKTHIQPVLKQAGFKKKGNYFYKTNNGFTHGIYVPIDREYTENGAYFTVQYGIYSEALEELLGREIKTFPKGYDFILNSNDLTQKEDEYERYLLESTTNLDTFGKKMSDDILQVLAFFNQITSLEAMIDYCLEHNYLVHHEDLMRYLVMQKDEEKTKKYMLKIKEKLDKIAANALARYWEKLEQLKAEYSSSTANN
jgi:Domain of unknown function (DUF4304)